jgi:radical SAM protein with 4Fe4S-binding SPASM domain
MCSVTFDWEKNDAMDKVKHFEKTRGELHGELLWATVEFTEVCNHRCIYCYENAGDSTARVMPRGKMEALIDFLGDSGMKQLTCSGGEPLMYPHIDEAVKRARDNGMVVHMITNGYFLTEKRARELASAGLSQIQTNIDSAIPRKHDWMRGKEGSFQHALQALKNAKEAGMTCVTQTVLTKENEGEILGIFKLARSLGVQRCRVWDIVPSEGRAESNMHLKPTQNYIQTLTDLAEWARMTGAVNVESGDPLFPQGRDTGMTVTGGYCPYSIGLLANLSINGDSYFCCTNRGKPMYNIFDIMNNGEYLKQSHAKALELFLEDMQMKMLPEECAACEFVRTCKGGCYMRRRYADMGRDYWCQREAYESREPIEERIKLRR